MTEPTHAHAVLIVEDERIVAKDLQQTLEGMGYDAYAIASSSEEALKRASERCPDVVLMDIRIKGPLDGIATAQLVRERFGVPVVYLTAHADDTTLERAKHTEPYGYLMKPVKLAELRSAIEISVYRHQVTKRLRERERWFATTLRSIGDAVITVDLRGQVTFMNPAAETLTGVSAAAGVGRPAREIVQLLTPDEPGSPLDQALLQRKIVTVKEAELAHPTQENPTISDTASPVEDGGELLGAVMVFRDITKEKVLQKKLELSDRLASLGTLAAGVAHEINNPLTSITGNSSFVLEELRSALTSTADPARLAEVIQAMEDIDSSAQRIAQIVASLRVFSRPEADATTGAAEVRRTVDWAVRTTAHEFRSRATVRARVEVLPRVSIDETRLGQVLINLLVNAAHAIAPGHLEDNFVTIDARADADNVYIDIRDTGRGMDEDVVKRVFEPFFTTKAVGAGTGLGLSICHGIVGSVGGRLEVESKPGTGTRFRLVLPLATRRTLRPSADGVAPEKRVGRILAIDDEPMLLRVLARTLRDHEVVGMDDGRKALVRIAGGEHFDVIITDMLMPHMTGKEFYERLLEDHPELVRKVIFLTGGTAGKEADAFLAAIPNVCLHKPIIVTGLREIVQSMLREA